MEEHRRNPQCTSCHKVIDPLGLALENFDVTGAWRIKDNEVPVDVVGDLYDGTRMDGPGGLRDALLKHSDMFLTSFTESLMTYGLGRRLEHTDMPAVRAIVRDAGKKGDRLSAYVLGVVNSSAFKMGVADKATISGAPLKWLNVSGRTVVGGVRMARGFSRGIDRRQEQRRCI